MLRAGCVLCSCACRPRLLRIVTLLQMLWLLLVQFRDNRGWSQRTAVRFTKHERKLMDPAERSRALLSHNTVKSLRELPRWNYQHRASCSHVINAGRRSSAVVPWPTAGRSLGGWLFRHRPYTSDNAEQGCLGLCCTVNFLRWCASQQISRVNIHSSGHGRADSFETKLFILCGKLQRFDDITGSLHI